MTGQELIESPSSRMPEMSINTTVLLSGWERAPAAVMIAASPCTFPAARWYSCRDLLPNSWLALTSSCQLLHLCPANPRDPATLTSTTYLFDLHLIPQCSRINFPHWQNVHKLHGNVFPTNKFWGSVFTCSEQLQPCNLIPLYCTSGHENQNSTPRFKTIATTDSIAHLSFQDRVN